MQILMYITRIKNILLNNKSNRHTNKEQRSLPSELSQNIYHFILVLSIYTHTYKYLSRYFVSHVLLIRSQQKFCALNLTIYIYTNVNVMCTIHIYINKISPLAWLAFVVAVGCHFFNTPFFVSIIIEQWPPTNKQKMI